MSTIVITIRMTMMMMATTTPITVASADVMAPDSREVRSVEEEEVGVGSVEEEVVGVGSVEEEVGVSREVRVK